jgi:hypothetical protein
MCELLHTLNASFLECGEHAVGTEWRAVAFSAGRDGGSGLPEQKQRPLGHATARPRPFESRIIFPKA